MKITTQNVELEFSNGKVITLTFDEYQELKSWLSGPLDFGLRNSRRLQEVTRTPAPFPPYDVTCHPWQTWCVNQDD